MKSFVKAGIQQAEKKITMKSNRADEELQSILDSHKTTIKIVGAGGAGNNALSRMVEVGIKGVETIAVNTDAQDLLFANADHKILLGKNITKGLGAGSDPSLGEEAARENEDEIRQLFEKTDMVFVTCGLGGGTGSGSAPVAAQLAKASGALTISVVTLPFEEEGVNRHENAMRSLKKLHMYSDTVIVIENDKLLEIVPDLPLQAAFKVADEILVNAVKGITELITEKGLVNLDFADVRAIMKNGGLAIIGIGESDSENRASDAIRAAIKNPLLDVDIEGAKSALVNITGGRSLSLKATKTIMKTLAEKLDKKARVIWGAHTDETLGDSVRVLLIATGLHESNALTQRLTEFTLEDDIDFQSIEKKNALTQQQAEKDWLDPAADQTAESVASPLSPPSVSFPAENSYSSESVSNRRLFTELFEEETEYDLKYLVSGIEAISESADNTKYLKNIKNACVSLKNTAQLFTFEHIETFSERICQLVDSLIVLPGFPAAALRELLEEVPDLMGELMYDDPGTIERANELSNKLSAFQQKAAKS
ncbi:cell division protein FtsZ [bacterium]|nr:cell division protein FtsZ [bacterium]